MHFVLRGRTAKNLTETIFRRRILSGRRVHKEQQIQEEQKSFLRQNFTKQFWDKIWHNVRDTILRKQFNKIWPTKNCWSRWTPFFYLVRETSVVTESPEAVRIRRALDRLGVDITPVIFSPHIQFWPKIVFTQKSVPDCVLIWETLQDCSDLTKSNYHCQTSLWIIDFW